MEEKSEVIYYKDIAFRRYPNSSKWADRNYYVPNATHRKRGIGRLHQEIWKDAHGLIPEGYHIHNLDTWPGIMLSILLASVKTVVKCFNILRWAIRSCIAPTSANLLLDANRASITSNASALFAGVHSLLTNIVAPIAVLVHVLSVCEEAKEWDTDRYGVASFDLTPNAVTYYKNIWR